MKTYAFLGSPLCSNLLGRPRGPARKVRTPAFRGSPPRGAAGSPGRARVVGGEGGDIPWPDGAASSRSQSDSGCRAQRPSSTRIWKLPHSPEACSAHKGATEATGFLHGPLPHRPPGGGQHTISAYVRVRGAGTASASPRRATTRWNSGTPSRLGEGGRGRHWRSYPPVPHWPHSSTGSLDGQVSSNV